MNIDIYTSAMYVTLLPIKSLQKAFGLLQKCISHILKGGSQFEDSVFTGQRQQQTLNCCFYCFLLDVIVSR